MDLFVDLDVSKDEIAICVRRRDGSIALARKTGTEPAAIAAALDAVDGTPCCVVLETGRMANWLHGALATQGLPVVCVDARQAHAVLSQMHNKTDENDAAMLAELARTGFYKRVSWTSVSRSQSPPQRRSTPMALAVART